MTADKTPDRWVCFAFFKVSMRTGTDYFFETQPDSFRKEVNVTKKGGVS
jgi:hypothetical protein